MTNEQKNIDRELAEKPVYYGQKGRALVWFWRAQAGYNLARRIDGEAVTVDEYGKARKLLDSCTRYALAAARQWECANNSERYANSAQCDEDERRLDARRERLNADLARYGVMMFNYGLYPTIVELDEESKRMHLFREAAGVALHYFD